MYRVSMCDALLYRWRLRLCNRFVCFFVVVVVIFIRKVKMWILNERGPDEITYTHLYLPKQESVQCDSVYFATMFLIINETRLTWTPNTNKQQQLRKKNNNNDNKREGEWKWNTLHVFVYKMNIISTGMKKDILIVICFVFCCCQFHAFHLVQKKHQIHTRTHTHSGKERAILNNCFIYLRPSWNIFHTSVHLNS